MEQRARGRPLDRLANGLPLTLVVLLALLLRAYRLGHLGFWFDEGASAYLAAAGRLADWEGDVHPPLYVALLSVWRLAADGDVWLRSDPYRARELMWVIHAHTEFVPRHDRVEAWLAAQLEPLGAESFEGIRPDRAQEGPLAAGALPVLAEGGQLEFGAVTDEIGDFLGEDAATQDDELLCGAQGVREA